MERVLPVLIISKTVNLGTRIINAYVCLGFVFSRLNHRRVSECIEARRGICNHVNTNNAKNLLRVEKYLKEFFLVLAKGQIKHYLGDIKTTWHFIPPRSLHVGGL